MGSDDRDPKPANPAPAETPVPSAERRPPSAATRQRYPIANAKKRRSTYFSGIRIRYEE